LVAEKVNGRAPGTHCCPDGVTARYQLVSDSLGILGRENYLLWCLNQQLLNLCLRGAE
jgi:hypothetical protein